jgi:hypothetical protein
MLHLEKIRDTETIGIDRMVGAQQTGEPMRGEASLAEILRRQVREIADGGIDTPIDGDRLFTCKSLLCRILLVVCRLRSIRGVTTTSQRVVIVG